MTEENKKEFGWGCFADKPYRFRTIERRVYAAKFYFDEVLKDWPTIVNPCNNQRVGEVKKTLCAVMGRHSMETTIALKGTQVKAMMKTVDALKQSLSLIHI